MLDTIAAAEAGDFSAPAAPTRESHRPEFTGTTREYFGIWFVNVLLTFVTLGIYSAWAKVRTERYFYAHTRLAGASFEYLASPIAILKGRLITFAVVIALVLSSRFMVSLYLFLVVAVGLLMPVFITWSLRFRARNSAWRGVRFHFDNDALDAYGPFMFRAWLTGLTLTLMYPSMKRRQHEFVVSGHRYGRKHFDFNATTGNYFVGYLIVAACIVLGVVAMGVGMAAVTAAMKGAVDASGKPTPQAMWAIMSVVIAFYAVMFVAIIGLRVHYTNVMWRYTRLLGHSFESTLSVPRMLWIYASNLVAIVFTLGLAVPWAKIRLARYRAEHFTLVADGDLDGFESMSGRRVGATGMEMADAFDAGLDVGF